MPAPEQTRHAEQQLIANLREQHNLHQRMLAELESKREAMRAADMERVFAISEREQRIVSRMAQLEQARLGLIATIMPTKTKQSNKQPTVSDLLPHLSERSRRDVEALQDSLRDRVQKVQELSSIIRSAGDALQQHIAGVVQSMQRVFSDAGVYERRGMVATGQRLASTIDVRS